MAWPAPLPGRLLEAVGNRGPRGMTVTGRELRTEPGLQAGFANFPQLPAASAPRRSPFGIVFRVGSKSGGHRVAGSPPAARWETLG